MRNTTTILLFAAAFAAGLLINNINIPEKPTHIRYFFVGFDAATTEHRHYGNFYIKGEMLPSIDSLETTVYETIHCEGYSRQDIVITAIYEFADSIEYKNFKVSPDVYNIKCD